MFVIIISMSYKIFNAPILTLVALLYLVKLFIRLLSVVNAYM